MIIESGRFPIDPDTYWSTIFYGIACSICPWGVRWFERANAWIAEKNGYDRVCE